MGVSKVVYGGQTIIDLTGDNVTADKLLKGYTAHGADGEPINGSCEFDANTQDATAKEDEILSGKTAYVLGSKRTGKMKNNGAVSGVISDKDDEYNVPQGYHDGSGKVGIDPTEKAKLIADNIRQGVEILGVVGSMSGSEDVKAQTKSGVIPKTTQQTITPDSGYNYITQVVVEAIPYAESDNSAGGKTVTIA